MTFFAQPGIGASFDISNATIPISSTTSNAVDLTSDGLVGFLMPSAFTGTTVTFLGSPDDVSYGALFNSNAQQFSITVAADRYFMLFPADFLGCRYVKFVSGSTEAAERVIKVMTRSFV